MLIEFGGGHVVDIFVPILDSPDGVNHLIPKNIEMSKNNKDITTALDIEPVVELRYIEPEITMTEIRI